MFEILSRFSFISNWSPQCGVSKIVANKICIYCSALYVVKSVIIERVDFKKEKVNENNGERKMKRKKRKKKKKESSRQKQEKRKKKE